MQTLIPDCLFEIIFSPYFYTEIYLYNFYVVLEKLIEYTL
jgi:hypothetical protein